MATPNEPTKGDESLVLTPVETARLLRIGRATVYEQIRQGTIPSIRLGRRILIPRAALMRKLQDVGESDCRLPVGGGGT